MYVHKLNLRDLIGLVLIGMIINPYLAVLNPVILIAVFIIWCVLAILFNKELFIRSISVSAIWINLLYIFTLIIFHGIDVLNAHVLLMPCVFVIAIYYLEGEAIRKKIAIMSRLLLIYIGMIVIYSLIVFSRDNTIARRLLSADDSIIKMYGSPLTADYYFIYSLVFLGIVIFILYIHHKQIKYLVAWSIIAFLIYKSEYLIALIFIIIFSIMAAYIFSSYLKKGLTGTVIIWPMVMIALFILLMCVGDDFLMMLISLDLNDNLTKRINYIYYFLYDRSSLGSTTDLSLRIYYYKMSWDTFIKHPLLGVGVGTDTYLKTVGGHASVQDNLAEFGILSNLLYYTSFFLMIKKVKKYLKMYGCLIMNILVVTFILMGCVNPIFNRLVYGFMFIIIPFMIYCHEFETNKE